MDWSSYVVVPSSRLSLQSVCDSRQSFFRELYSLAAFRGGGREDSLGSTVATTDWRGKNLSGKNSRHIVGGGATNYTS